MIKFQNPAMKKYEAKQAPSLLPVVIIIAIIAMVARYLIGAEAPMGLPHAELNRWLPTGGSESLVLNCKPEATKPHFFCNLEQQQNGMVVASTVIDEKDVRSALGHFFSRWPSRPAPATKSEERLSLSWSVADGDKIASGEAKWLDPSQRNYTTAVLSLEGELIARFYR